MFSDKITNQIQNIKISFTSHKRFHRVDIYSPLTQCDFYSNLLERPKCLPRKQHIRCPNLQQHQNVLKPSGTNRQIALCDYHFREVNRYTALTENPHYLRDTVYPCLDSRHSFSRVTLTYPSDPHINHLLPMSNQDKEQDAFRRFTDNKRSLFPNYFAREVSNWFQIARHRSFAEDIQPHPAMEDVQDVTTDEQRESIRATAIDILEEQIAEATQRAACVPVNSTSYHDLKPTLDLEVTLCQKKIEYIKQSNEHFYFRTLIPEINVGCSLLNRRRSQPFYKISSFPFTTVPPNNPKYEDTPEGRAELEARRRPPPNQTSISITSGYNAERARRLEQQQRQARFDNPATTSYSSLSSTSKPSTSAVSSSSSSTTKVTKKDSKVIFYSKEATINQQKSILEASALDNPCKPMTTQVRPEQLAAKHEADKIYPELLTNYHITQNMTPAAALQLLKLFRSALGLWKHEMLKAGYQPTIPKDINDFHDHFKQQLLDLGFTKKQIQDVKSQPFVKESSRKFFKKQATDSSTYNQSSSSANSLSNQVNDDDDFLNFDPIDTDDQSIKQQDDTDNDSFHAATKQVTDPDTLTSGRLSKKEINDDFNFTEEQHVALKHAAARTLQKLTGRKRTRDQQSPLSSSSSSSIPLSSNVSTDTMVIPTGAKSVSFATTLHVDAETVPPPQPTIVTTVHNAMPPQPTIVTTVHNAPPQPPQPPIPETVHTGELNPHVPDQHDDDFHTDDPHVPDHHVPDLQVPTDDQPTIAPVDEHHGHHLHEHDPIAIHSHVVPPPSSLPITSHQQIQLNASNARSSLAQLLDLPHLQNIPDFEQRSHYSSQAFRLMNLELPDNREYLLQLKGNPDRYNFIEHEDLEVRHSLKPADVTDDVDLQQYLTANSVISAVNFFMRRTNRQPLMHDEARNDLVEHQLHALRTQTYRWSDNSLSETFSRSFAPFLLHPNFNKFLKMCFIQSSIDTHLLLPDLLGLFLGYYSMPSTPLLDLHIALLAKSCAKQFIIFDKQGTCLMYSLDDNVSRRHPWIFLRDGDLVLPVILTKFTKNETTEPLINPFPMVKPNRVVSQVDDDF